MAEQNGTVLHFGTATAHGSLAGVPAKSPVTSIAAMPVGLLRAPVPERHLSATTSTGPNAPGRRRPQTVALPGPPSYPSPGPSTTPSL